MRARAVPVCVLMLGPVVALAAPAREKVAVDPNQPQKTRAVVSQPERERLGIKPHTWTGVVDPKVYTKLDDLKQEADRLKEKNNTQAVQALFRVQYDGAVYIQIEFKDQDGKRRALATLTACDLHVRQVFVTPPALLGYTAKEGLDKLSKNPDVVGVCLDDQPLPESNKIITKNDLPPAKPGEAANEPGVAEKKVDPDVYRALAAHGRVYVLVSLNDESFPKMNEGPTDVRARNELRNKAEKQLQDRALSALKADEFWLWIRLGPGIGGFVDKTGIAKLLKHPDVRLIRLDERRRVLE